MCRGCAVRFGFGIGAVCGFVFYAASAVAKTVECDAVDELANVGLRSVDTVTVSADEDDKICKFAVNGVAASSPPGEVVAEAYSVIIWRRDERGWLVNGELNNVPLNKFAALLLAAGPDAEIGDVVSILEQSRDALTRCVSALRHRTAGSADAATTQGEFRCMTVVRDHGDMTASMGPIRADLSELEGMSFVPQLIVAVTRGSQWNVLIAPGFLR